MPRRATVLLVLSILLAGVAGASGADWPNWLGPKHDGSSPEKGLLSAFPAGGPKVVWRVPGGDGYSTVAVAGGKAITLVQTDAEYVLALDAAKGDVLWKQKLGPAFKNSYGNGPRSTPTIEGDRVYVQSVTGTVACLKADSGDVVWSRNLLQEFGAKNITWGLSASPRLVGDLVLVIPGAKGAEVAALDKRTGKTVWQTGSGKAAYATPVVAAPGGSKQAIFFTAPGLQAVDLATGKEAWRLAWETEFDCNIATPLLVGDRLFVSSGEGVGCGVLELTAGGPPETVWRFQGKKSPLTTYWATAVHHEGSLYGIAGEFNKRLDLNCVDLKTGKLRWSQPDFGKASVTLADGHLWLVTKKGDLVLARANPEKYEEKGRVKLLGDNRTAATISNGKLFLRDRKEIVCLDIGGK